MKLYEITCGTCKHQIGLNEKGSLHLLDHDIEEEETLVMMGVKPCRCYDTLLKLESGVNSAFLQGAFENDIELTRICIGLGADVHYMENEALYYACRFGYLGMVKTLIQHGADVNRPYKFSLNCRNYQGVKTSHHSVNILKASKDCRHQEVVQYLTELGAS